MIKTCRCISGRMAGKTCRAVVCITSDAIVLVVRVSLVMLMAVDATELGVI